MCRPAPTCRRDCPSCPLPTRYRSTRHLRHRSYKPPVCCLPWHGLRTSPPRAGSSLSTAWRPKTVFFAKTSPLLTPPQHKMQVATTPPAENSTTLIARKHRRQAIRRGPPFRLAFARLRFLVKPFRVKAFVVKTQRSLRTESSVPHPSENDARIFRGNEL